MSSQDAIADQLAVAAQDLKRALDVETDLEAENARLQERVEELEGVLHGDKGAIADQRAVILKLQARVEEAEERATKWTEARPCIPHTDKRDSYCIDCWCLEAAKPRWRAGQAEALAERRKEALVRLERGYDNHPGFMTMGKSGEECLHCGCLGGHGDVCPFAAIDISPEEAREKEGR